MKRGKHSIARTRRIPGKLTCTLLSLALVCALVPQVCLSALAQALEQEEVSVAAGYLTAEDSGAWIDISDMWEEGSCTLSEAGNYYLSRNVETSYPLEFAANDAETIVLDFAGHTATVEGELTSALDISNSLGQVFVIDSSCEEGDARGEGGLVFVAHAVQERVFAINYTPALTGEEVNSQLTLSGLSVSLEVASKLIDASFVDTFAYGLFAGTAESLQGDNEAVPANVAVKNCSFEVVLQTWEASAKQESKLYNQYASTALVEENCTQAFGIYESNACIKLSGSLQIDCFSSLEDTCDLLASTAAAYAICKDFVAVQTLVIDSADEEFASCADESTDYAGDFEAAYEGKEVAQEDGTLLLKNICAQKLSIASVAEQVIQIAEDSSSEVNLNSISNLSSYTWLSDTTYYLSADLTVSSFTISGADNVTIKLNGYNLTINNETQRGLWIIDSKNFCLDGVDSNGKCGSIIYSPSVSTSNKHIAISFTYKDSTALETTTIKNCNITCSGAATKGVNGIGYSAYSSTSSYSGPSDPSDENEKLILENVNIAVSTSSSASSTSALYHVAGVEAGTRHTEISNSTIAVTSTGNMCASAVFTRALQGEICLEDCTLTLNGATTSYGVYCYNTLDKLSISGLSATFQSPSSDTNSYGIYPTAASTELCLAGEFAMSGFSTDVFVQATEAIKIASSFSAKSSLAIEMILNTVANPSREYFAVYDGWAPTDNQLELISSYFVNSQGASAANVPKADAFGILFETDTSLASAKIGDEFYGTCLDACFHASTGDLIELTSQYDGSGLEITVGDQGQEITIDMKGATSSYLYFDNNATYTILNGTFNRGFNHSLSYSTNVYASAICAYSGSLILKQITAEVTDTSLTHYSLSYGIFSMCSDLSLVSSEISGVYCAVYSRNSGSVKVEDSSLAASSTVLNLGASNGVEITGSTITTPGLAVYQYSAALKITNSHISAEQGVNNLSTFATSVDTCVFDVSDYSFNFTYTTSTLALDGECGFSAPIAYSGVMNLGDNLSIAPGYGTAFYVTTSSGEGDAFAQAATSGTDISAYAGLFWANVSTNEAGIDTPEMEAMVSPVANSELWWAAEESCTVTHEGTTTVYYSFTKAIAALEEGDTLTLLRDVVTKASFTLSNSGTMDLNGHELEVVADGTAYTTQPYMAAQYANSVCAAVVCAASSFVLTDSSGTGAGTLRLSGDELTCGLAYSGSGELNISNVTIVATCTTSSTVTKFYGLMNTSGTLNLNSGASLEVYAQEQQSSASVALSSSLNSLQSALSADTTSIFAAQDVGALACAGIFQARNTSGEAGTTNVNSGASVSVVSSTTGSSAGSITNSNNNGSGGTGDMGTYYVREIHPAVGTTLYNEIYSMFSARATYSSGRYSLEKASLSDGTYIWAYSDLCTEGEEGACVPSTIYVTTTYTTPATAYGVYLQINTDGVINVSGSVQVISSTAEVAAVYADGTGKIAVDGASLAAATSFSTVRQNTGEKSLNSSAYLVEEVALSGYLITAPSSASTTVTLSGACSLNLVAEGGAGVTLPASSLLVDSSFMVAENSVDSSLSVRLPDGNVSGANFATAAKSTISAAQALYFTDADGLLGAGLTDDASHLVWSSGYTVRFLVITTGYTDAVEGADAWEEVAVYDDALYGQAVAVPSASTAQREGSLYYTYTFLGWATDPDATEVELEKTASYLTVTDSATYYAIYERTLIARTVKIQGAYDSDGNAIDTITMSQVKYCDSLGEALANHNVEMPQAQDYVSGDYTYRFVGWYFSADGTTGLYYDAASVEEYLIFNNSKSNYSVADTLTAKYVQVASGQTFVRFKVDYLICGYAASVGGQTDYSKAAGLSVYSAPSACVSETGYTRSFAGWKSGYYNTYEHWNTSSTHTADFTSNPLETIASSQDGDTITYTAVFNKSLTKCTVSVVYYAQNSSGTWVQTTKSLSYSYGTSGTVVAADIAELVGDGFTQSGVVYTFIGLGARSTDTYATWSLDSSADNFIPNVGYSTSFTSTAGNANETTSTTTTYYAIYSQAQQMVNVTFMAKDESGEYVVVATTSEAIAATTALNEVISGTYLTGSTSAKVSSLTNSTWTDTITDTDYYLTGWALEADASDSRSGNAVVMPNAGDTVTYYAVYGEAAKAYIRFYEDEDADEYFKSITVRTGTVLGAASNFPDAPAKEGYYFVGWMDYSTGVIIDPSTYVVSGNMSLIATYEEITFDLSGVCEGVEVDTSGLAIDSSGITLVAVAVNVVAESSVDRNLSAKYSSSTADSYYTVSIVLTTQDGEEVCVTSDFGTLGISFVPASAQELMRVWWLDVDEDGGCVSYTDQQDATTEEVVVATISSYNTSDYGANMAIAYEQTEAAKELAMAISNYMSQLDELYGTEFREADYTDEGWEELGLVYEAGLAAIKEATTLDEAYEATIAAIAAMEAVEKDLSTELALAKAEALVKLVNAYAKLDSSNYTKKEWKQVKQAYKAGRSAINAATTIASAISAANAAINAVNSIIPSASSSSTLSGSSTGSAVLASSSGSSSAVLSKSSTSSGAVKSSKSSDDEEEATEEESVEEEVAEEVSTELESSVEDEEALLGDESDEDEGSSVLDWIRDHLALTVGAGLALLAGLVALLLLLLGRKANEADQLDTAAIASTNTIEF